MFDARMLPIRILLGILKRDIRRHLCWDFLADHLTHPVNTRPLNIPKQVVEALNDVAQPIQLRLWLEAATHRGDLSVLIWQSNTQRCLFLDAIAGHVNRFKDAARQFFFLLCEQADLGQFRRLLAFPQA